jgi:hypothetical protein
MTSRSGRLRKSPQHKWYAFGESVAAPSRAHVVARGSDAMLPVSRQKKCLAPLSPGNEVALDGSCF